MNKACSFTFIYDFGHGQSVPCVRGEDTARPDKELEMLVNLRMNREFMQFMWHNHLTKDHFGFTVVSRPRPNERPCATVRAGPLREPLHMA